MPNQLPGGQAPSLVVFDVDGTLLDSEGICRPRTRAALERLRSHGIGVALATGRPLALAPFTLETVGFADWIACGNGASLLETSTGRLHRDAVLPPETVESLVRELRRRLPGVGFSLELPRSVISEPGFRRRVPPGPHPEPVDDVLEVLRRAPSPVRKIAPYHDDYDTNLQRLAVLVEQVVDDRCEVHCHGGLPFVEVALKGDHKAVALQLIVDHLRTEARRVIAFGDGRNDIEMLEWAGVGVAMGQAVAEVRDAADRVTHTNDHDGVAVFLEPLLDDLEGR